MRMLYMKPELDDLSQGSRIDFTRKFRFMTQDNVLDKLGLTSVCKKRTMTRYEKGDRNPKDERTMEIARILNVSYNAIKKYDLRDLLDLFNSIMDEKSCDKTVIKHNENMTLFDKLYLGIEISKEEYKKLLEIEKDILEYIPSNNDKSDIKKLINR